MYPWTLQEYEEFVKEQEALAEHDIRSDKVARFFEAHPETWPRCMTCGQVQHPTGTTPDGRIEFHCGQSGHYRTILYTLPLLSGVI